MRAVSIVLMRTLFILPTIFLALACAQAIPESLAEESPAAELAAGRSVSRELRPGRFHVYRIPVPASCYVRLAIGQGAADLEVVVHDPNGRAVGVLDVLGSGRESGSFIAEVTGNFRLAVRPVQPLIYPARYTLKVVESRSATAPDKTRIAAERALAEAKSMLRTGSENALNEALQHAQRAVELSRSVSATREQALAFDLIGRIHSDFGDWAEALKAHSQALALWEKEQEVRSRIGTHLALGSAYRALGEKQKPLWHYRRALRLSRQVQDRLGEARALRHIGIEYDSWGQREKAFAFLQRALRLFRAAGSAYGEAQTLSRLAMWYREERNVPQALQYLAEALHLHRRLRDADGEAEALGNLGYVHHYAGDCERALDYFSRAFSLRQAAGSRAGQAGMLYAMARAEMNCGRLWEARRHMEAAISIMEGLRRGIEAPPLRSSYFSLKQGYYWWYADILVKLHRADPSGGHAEAAFEASERGRARNLLEFLGAGRFRPEFLSLPNVQRHILDEETLLLEYWIWGARGYLWAVTSDRMRVFELPGDPLRAGVRRLCTILAERSGWNSGKESLRRYRELATDLSRTLLGPAAELLRQKRRLVIVPDPELARLPFAALPDPAIGGSEGPPLIASHEIVYLPSVNLLASLRRQAVSREQAPKTLAILADPVFDRQDARLRRGPEMAARPAVVSRAKTRNAGGAGATRFPRLPFSRREAEAILSLVPPEEAMRALDFAASRATVTSGRLRQYQILHFATHSLLDQANPEDSGLVLSLVDERGAPQDGILRVREIANLHLPAELVVLSGCQTAVGKEVMGEGMVGLAHGFLHAGPLRVVASLWQVEDEATAELMQRFYKGMLGKQRLAPAAALREAQLAMWHQKRWRAPYFWAGFVLQGEWR